MNAIVLAAGLSRRMGRQKLLLPFGEGSILGTVLANLMRADVFDTIALVISCETLARFESLHPSLLSAMCPSLVAVVNRRPEDGQAGSLRLGLETAGGSDFCVTLGDLPLISAAQYAKYAGIFLSRPEKFTALVPKRGAVLGHPVFFSPVWQERLAASVGDAGGRGAIRAHEEEVLRMRGEDAFFQDVDTAEDYAAIAQNGQT